MSLEQSIGKRQPFRSLEQKAFLTAWRMVSILERFHIDLFAQHGLSPQTYNALRILRGHGEDGISVSGIRRELVTLASDTSRLVQKLEEKGLAERRAAQGDKRTSMVFITKRGLDLLGELDGPVIKCHDEQLGHMGKRKLAQLIALLDEAKCPHERFVR